MLTFPSRVQVFRSREGRRYVVAVHNHFGSDDTWGCIATGDTAEDAERKAREWTWTNVHRAASRGSLTARLALLEQALHMLFVVLNTSLP